MASQYLYEEQLEDIEIYKKYLDNLGKKLAVSSNQIEFYTKGDLLLDTLVKNKIHQKELRINNFNHFDFIYIIYRYNNYINIYEKKKFKKTFFFNYYCCQK